MIKKSKRTGFKWRDTIWLGIFILALYVLLPQISSFKNSWHLIANPSLSFVSLALLVVAITYFAAAATYCLLALRPLNYFDELVMQLAAMFINRLLPAGIGGIGANYEYLKNKGHSSNEAASIVAVNNSLGFIGHLSILALALILNPAHKILPASGFSHGISKGLQLAGVLVAVAAIVAVITSYKRIKNVLHSFAGQLSSYTHKPFILSSAFLSQVVLSLSNIYCLMYAADAVGLHMSFASILLIFTFGAGIRSVVPTPGGIGGFEAGLVAGFVAYKVTSSEALAAVLLFRIISYWLPLVLGAVAFTFIQSRHWLSVKHT